MQLLPSPTTDSRNGSAEGYSSKARHVYEGSTVVRLAIWRGMFKDRVRRTCGHLATAEVKYRTHILCVKDEYAARINGILCVVSYLTSIRGAKSGLEVTISI
jgi:hypothetical protein